MENAIQTNQNTGMLKLLALATMLVDHIGAVLFPQAVWLRIIGRVSYPLFAYCMALGGYFTHDLWSYAKRLLCLGIVSQPVYVLCFGGSWLDLNIFFTLLAGLLGIFCIQKRRYWGNIVLAGLVIAFWNIGSFSYGAMGVALIWVFYLCLNSRIKTAFFAGLWLLALSRFYPYPVLGTGINIPIQALAVFSLVFILMPLKTNWRLPKWLFYGFYPAHLLVLYALLQLV